MDTVANALLAPVSTVEVPATTESFHVFERFAVDWDPAEAQVNISLVGDNFNAWYGNMLVDAQPGSTLACHTLTRTAENWEILSALGGEAKCEITIAEIWQLMLLQRNGRSGALLTNGDMNIFYVRVRDRSLALRVVDIFWRDGGWHVGASVFDCRCWNGGPRVFVRNSCVR